MKVPDWSCWGEEWSLKWRKDIPAERDGGDPFTHHHSAVCACQRLCSDCFVFSGEWVPLSGPWLKVMKFQVYLVLSRSDFAGILSGQSLQPWKLTGSRLEKALEMLALVPMQHWLCYHFAACWLQNWISRCHHAFFSLQQRLYSNSSGFCLVCKMDHWTFWLASHVVWLWTWANAFAVDHQLPQIATPLW